MIIGMIIRWLQGVITYGDVWLYYPIYHVGL